MPDIIVKNQAELDAALSAARGGETIKLAAGEYTSININGKNYTSAVTVESLTTANQAVVQSLVVVSSSNLTVKNLQLVQDYKPAEDWMFANQIRASKNIVLDGTKITGGSGDPSLSLGVGLYIRDSNSITLKNSSVDHFGLGVTAQNVDGMTVQGNDFHDNRRDHTNFSEMSNVLIDNNMFTNLFPVGAEHPDAIQFFTRGKTKGSSNITISNNVVMQGDGLGTQGIFMNDENGNLPYENVNIKNNLVYLSGWYHGINVVNGRDVKVESNTIISKMDGTPYWIRLEKANGAIVTNNVTDSVVITPDSANVYSNNNAVFATDSVTLRKLYDINAVSQASLGNLLVSGVGYQPPAGSAAAALVASQLSGQIKPANGNMLLDLQFNTSGIHDQSRWSSDETVKAVDTTAVSNGMFKVKTGTGFELSRDYSRQLYSMSAFTLSFDLKRDSNTAAVGQIIGIYKSWDVSLRADGELTFTINNAAGKAFTVVTSGANIKDTASHKIALTYDSVRGRASIYVDGAVKGSAAVSGSTRPVEFWGLYVGAPFSAAFSGAVGDIEVRDGALSASEVLALKTSTAPGQSPDVVKYSLTKGVASSAAALLATTGSSALSTAAATLASASSVGATAQVAVTQKTALASVALAGDLGDARFGQRSALSGGGLSAMLYHAV